MGNRRSRTVTHHHHHDDRGARDHSYRMQQLSNQRASAQAREAADRRNQEQRIEQQRAAQAAASKKAERDHQARMEQLAKQRALEMQKEQEKQREAQRVFEQRKKQMKLDEKNAAITSVKGDITRFENRNATIKKELAEKLKPEFHGIEEQFTTAQKDMEMFTETSQKSLNEIDTKIKKHQEEYKAADDKIRAAIATTNVAESNIPQFLNLVNDGLLFATMRGQHERDKMTAKLKVFTDLMERTCAAKLAIETYFKDQGLQRFTPILAEEGYTKMFELKCDDDEEWKEMRVMLEEGLIKSEKKDKKKQKMKTKERKSLKKLCTNEDIWLPEQIMQEDIVRKSLLTSAPRLSKFFGILHEVTNEVDELLKLEPKLTEQQQKAIAYVEEKGDKDEEKMESVEDIHERELWDKDSDCLILPPSDDVWRCGRVVDITYDSRGEWLQVDYAVGNETKSIQTQRFSKDIQPVSARKALAKGSKCEIYSESEGKWIKGCVVNIKTDDAGEWLQVEYSANGNKRAKDIGRYSPQIRCGAIGDNGDAFSQSKDVANIEFKEKEMNLTNKQCNALNMVVIKKLHIAETLVGDFVVDQKEMEEMEARIDSELKPKQQELESTKEQLEDVQVAIELIKDEIEMLEEEETDEDSDDSDDDGSDKEDTKKEMKDLKKKKKKMKLKQKKLQLSVKKLENRVNIIEARRGEIVSIGDVLKEAYTVACNIEDSCLQIIKSQCTMRQSLLLARELLKYKPAQPQAQAKPLWDTITKGIGDIFDNALQLNKISAVYFGFFTKFRYSFDHFVTANKMKKNVSMLVAMEHLTKDVSDIQAFQLQMDGKVDRLRESAINTIRDCVRNTTGAHEFDTAIKERKIAEVALREANGEYNQKRFKLDNAFQQKFATLQHCIASKRNVEFKIQELNKNAAMNEQWIQQLGQQVKALESLMVT